MTTRRSRSPWPTPCSVWVTASCNRLEPSTCSQALVLHGSLGGQPQTVTVSSVSEEEESEEEGSEENEEAPFCLPRNRGRP